MITSGIEEWRGVERWPGLRPGPAPSVEGDRYSHPGLFRPDLFAQFFLSVGSTVYSPGALARLTEKNDPARSETASDLDTPSARSLLGVPVSTPK